MLELDITTEQKRNVVITPRTAVGNPASLDGAPSWTVASGNCTLEIAPDGLSADIISADTPGESMIVIEADADLGAGFVPISDSIKMVVNGAMAVSLGLTAGPAVPK